MMDYVPSLRIWPKLFNLTRYSVDTFLRPEYILENNVLA